MDPKLPSMQDMDAWKDKLSEKCKALRFWDSFTWKHWTAIFICVLLVFVLAFFAFFGMWESRATENDGIPIYVKVQSGMTSSDIGEELQNRGVIANKNQFWLMAKLKGYEKQFKAGSYAFHANMHPQEVFDKLLSGATTKYKFVIPEGYSVLDIAKLLEKEGIVDREKFLALAKEFAPYSYMEKDKNSVYRAEGFLFPATYTVSTDVTEQDILKVMAETFDSRLTETMRQEAKEKGLSIYELVTLASLVEKEARYAEDRPIIAQVFFKRMKVGMPLQSDAPFQYLKDAPKEDLSIEDTKVDSPYNTYQHMGLPPGPIANPGVDSIDAVLHPSATDYLYFVADREGHNHYSHTYAEHLDIVDQVR